MSKQISSPSPSKSPQKPYPPAKRRCTVVKSTSNCRGGKPPRKSVAERNEAKVVFQNHEDKSMTSHERSKSSLDLSSKNDSSEVVDCRDRVDEVNTKLFE